MSYKIVATDEFQKDVKKLYKKYRSIKSDILELIDRLETDYDIGINLGDNLYKIRIKNSDIGGKSGGYRVIYFTKLSNNKIYLITMYSKTQKDSIDLSKLKFISQKINKL